MKIFALTFMVFSMPSLSVYAEDAAAPTPAAPPRWETSAEASVLLTSGNTQVTTLGLGAGSTFRPLPWTVRGRANYLTSKSTGVVTAESFNADLRGERVIYGALNAYAAANYLKNEFMGFDSRVGGEAGASFNLLTGPEHTASAEVGFGVMNESLVNGVPPATTAAGDRTFATARIGAEYKWKFSETADFTDTLSLLENLQTMADWRLSNTASVTAMLNDILSLKVSFQVSYLNQPVAAKSTDTTTTVALVAKF